MDKNSLLYEKEFYVYILPAEIVENEDEISCGDTIVLHGSSMSYNYLWSPQEILLEILQVSIPVQHQIYLL